MTKDELRIAVAEARGWERKKLSERDTGGAIHRYYAWVRVDNNGDEEERLRLPDYPNSMDACMPLIEEMRWDKDALGNLYERQITIEYHHKWVMYLYAHGEYTCHAMGDTLPEAICEVYLEWKGEQ